MTGDLILTLTIAALDVAFLFTLLGRRAAVSPITAALYTVIMTIGTGGFLQNHQLGPFAAQMFGATEWLLMLMRSLTTRQAAQTPPCLHWWEIVGQPWTEHIWDYNRAALRSKTFWHERCSACGDPRTASVWGTWTLTELTGEAPLGVAKPTFQADSR